MNCKLFSFYSFWRWPAQPPNNILVFYPPPLNPQDQILLTEVQLLLSEKRTSLAVLQTGLAFITITITFLSVLIATSKYYNFFEVLYLMIPLLAILLSFLILGTILIIKSFRKIRYFDRTIERLKKKHSILSEII